MTIDWTWVDKRVFVDANDLLAYVAVSGAEGLPERLRALIEEAEDGRA